MKKAKNPCVLYVATYPPRECGIATFTEDLTNAIDKEYSPGIQGRIMAMNDDSTTIYNYPRKVTLQINETDIEDYLNRANEINKSPHIKLVNIQHEYGIYGGDWGCYILPFLELLKKPVVTTFHTVLPDPTEKVKKLTKAITEKSAGIIVMTHHAANLLEQVYGVKKYKINIIPHGVHHVAFPSKTRAKQKLNLSGHTILSTFGMLNRDKGIEYAIEALPEIIKQYPDVMYLILGATHPVVRRQEGESYRNKLKRTISKLGLNEYVKFYNKYLTLEELIEFLKATDIYISPTLNPKQAVSGTISYALSCACPIISTKNQYACDVINHERGILVDFCNAKQIEEGLFDLLADKKKREEMKKNAYFYSRHMTWQNVALSYFKTFNTFAKIMPREQGKLPVISLGQIKNLTKDFGIIQFAVHTKPDTLSGYCLDDNARALLGFANYYNNHPTKQIEDLILKYFKFVKYAQKSNGKFYNLVNYNRSITDVNESEDSFGRAIWSLGYVINNDNLPEELRKRAKTIFDKTSKWTPHLISLRAVSFTILGLFSVAEKFQTLSIDSRENKKYYDRQIALIKRLSDKLIKKFNYQTKEGDGANDENWLWFEDFLTYSNFKLPEALFRAYKLTKNKEYLEVAEKSLDFLVRVGFENNYFSPIGQDGWYFRKGTRAYFDQQPEDTASAVECLVTAFETTGKKIYADLAKTAFDWFLGKNHLNQMVYDEATGGCYDGLGKYSINFNQGAESTLSYFLARLAIDKIK
jgi:glycosyltransferase involved in cell wall biosynthesis